MDIIQNINLGVLNLFLQIFLAYHIFHLSRNIWLNQRLENRENIRSKIDSYIFHIEKEKLNHKVYIANSKTYNPHNQKNSENFLYGYNYLGAEIKNTRSYWVELFCDMPIEVYRKDDWKLTFKDLWRDPELKVFTVGVIPYEWIDFFDERWDESSYVPLFHVRFNGTRPWKKYIPCGSPYSQIEHYIINPNYNKESDPADYKYKRIYEPIFKS
jgi:hypothetical protein